MTYRGVVACVSFVVVAGCGTAPQHVPPSSPIATQRASNQIIGTRAEGTAKELLAKGERALLAQRWQEAADAFEALLAGDPSSANDPQVLYDLAIAYEGLGHREKARERYREIVRRFPTDANARNALVREASLDAYLEDWSALGEVGKTILARADADPAEKMLGLGARGLARVQAGDDTGASRDIHDGLNLMDEHRYGATGQLPVAAAMIKYADGELRRTRSEKISLNPPGPDFLQKLETRCAHLLEAQSAYADAIRSVDPHWAAMSGFRVGEMYRKLHTDLMLIPPTEKAKTEHDKQLFYGIMRVRYRVLLEKGLEMMKRTLALGERTGAAPVWMKRAEAAKIEMERALEEEKAVIAKFPFTEEELQKALEIMKKRAADDQAKANKK
ncbi:MAG: tetratricopeptide repeat protein [Labilithrix sp.]|nr:tetratricopeptide repeat protein [Labilithrix sp.]